MERQDLNLSLLSFGDTGMEYVAGQTTDQLDEDHITMLGNFFANVLGAAEDASGLFGPLPVAYRYDLLLFVFGFSSYDSTVKDQRVIDSNHQTRSSLLLFFPAKLDTQFAQNRSQIRSILTQWSQKYLTKEIRSVKRSDLENLVNEIVSMMIVNSSKKELSESEAQNLIKVAGKNFYLLEMLGRSLEKEINIKLFSNNHILGAVLKRSLLQENIDIITSFSSKENKSVYNLPHLQIEEINLGISSNLKSLKGKNDGILFLSDLPTLNELPVYEANISKILNNTAKDSVISLCLGKRNPDTLEINETKVPQILANQSDRTISLVDLRKYNYSIEIALIDFVEKIVSKIASVS